MFKKYNIEDFCRTSNMDFLMKLYLMNLVQQQQKSSSAYNMSNIQPPTVPLADQVANSNYFQQLFLQNAIETMQTISNDINTNLFGNQINNSFVSSTVTSTPTSSFDDNEYRANISAQPTNSSTNNFSTPSSISSDEKSYTLMDAGSTISPLSMSTPKNTKTFSPSMSGSDSDKSIKLEQRSTSSTSLQLFSNSSTDILIKEENLKNLKKYASFMDCESKECFQIGIREHFHCYENPCSGKVLTKKEDIIRHLKWHKKRKESLNFGFLRFSSYDDCLQSFGSGCQYCWKQTHYHCVEEKCSKVYVSTSDVQMHANFHRKNTEIIQEGFQRFRAVEDCKTNYCIFSGKGISHYHCRRDECQHTFKNKADMDKHKTFHMKHEQLTQDGYKKVLKTECCPFQNCEFSNVNTHIHCIRENCYYILHTSSQLVSHKRKHDKQISESLQLNNTSGHCVEFNELCPQPNSKESTPVSSLSSRTSHFLSRKRGRPTKKIQANINKKLKMNTLTSECYKLSDDINHSAANNSNLPNVTPNVQLTHLMALFKLQNTMQTKSTNG